MIEAIGEIDIRPIAEGDDGRQADAAARGPFDERGGDRAGLRHEGEVARRGGVRGEASIEPRMRRHHAEAIGPDQPEAVPPRREAHRLGRRSGSMTEPGRHNERGGRSLGARRFDHGRHGRGRRCDDHEVGRARETVEARGRALPADHGRARIDEVDAAGKARRAQVAQDGKADRTFAVARPDKRDGGWREQLVETVGGHNGRSALSLCRRRENEAVPTRLRAASEDGSEAGVP